ncbi:MAG TPA: magnesium transporter, partial [Pyrodictium sp.]|nr:magnesium transporter [Pyrodictium sp.]
YLALLSFKIGIDPDNVLAPILTSIADVTGIASLTLMLNLITSLVS